MSSERSRILHTRRRPSRLRCREWPKPAGGLFPGWREAGADLGACHAGCPPLNTVCSSSRKAEQAGRFAILREREDVRERANGLTKPAPVRKFKDPKGSKRRYTFGRGAESSGFTRGTNAEDTRAGESTEDAQLPFYQSDPDLRNHRRIAENENPLTRPEGSWYT